MRRYLLDNGIVVAFMKGRPGALRLIQPRMAAHEAATSVVVYGEAIEYFKTQPGYAKFLAGLRTFLREVSPLRLTYPILERYADLRLALRLRGELIGDVDTLIAATALEHGLTLVTLDSDFARIPSLALMHLDRAALL